MSRPVRTTYFWSMGRDAKHMREELNEPNERVESSERDESDKPNKYSSTPCPRRDDPTCPVGNYCSDRECPKCKCYNCTCDENRDLPNPHGDSCTCPNCRNYNDYTEHIAKLIDPERERSSTGIWIGNELRTFKQTDNGTTNDVEYITGISAGVTI